MAQPKASFLMVQESIKHFPIPLRKSLKVIAEGDFLVRLITCHVIILAYLLSRPIFAESILKEHALEYRAQGYEAQKKGMLLEALSYYQKAINTDPLYICAYNDLGIVYEMLGQTNAAEEVYIKAISLDPKYAQVWTNLALLYERKGDYLSAAKCWIRRVYSGDPGDLWTKKAQERIYEIGRIIPEVKELYYPIASSQNKPDEVSVLKSYFENPDKFFQERESPN